MNPLPTTTVALTIALLAGVSGSYGVPSQVPAKTGDQPIDRDGSVLDSTTSATGDRFGLGLSRTVGSRQRGMSGIGGGGVEIGDSGQDVVVSAWSAPQVVQASSPEFDGLELRECPADVMTTTYSCYDSGTGDAFFVREVEDDEVDDDEEAEGPPTVTGAQLATAVREYVRVRIAPAPLILQPDQDWHLVNLPVIVRTEPVAQDFATELLGLPVEIRAEPVSYSWDFGDGSPVVNTTDPGAAYPIQTIEHPYAEAGEYQITLVTYWSGSFRVAGGPWIGIDGLGVTATSSPVLDLQTRTTRLVG